jgi:hypothetical protein
MYSTASPTRHEDRLTMTDSQQIIPSAGITRQKAAIPGRSRRGDVTGKLKVALDHMIWDGDKRADAATKAGLTDQSLRSALRKPHVLQYYNAELAALRTSLRAKNAHRLDTIAESSQNDMAKVGAIKAMEQIADQADEKQRPGMTQVPGLQIVIIQGGGSTAPVPTIDVIPNRTPAQPE